MKSSHAAFAITILLFLGALTYLMRPEESGPSALAPSASATSKPPPRHAQSTSMSTVDHPDANQTAAESTVQPTSGGSIKSTPRDPAALLELALKDADGKLKGAQLLDFRRMLRKALARNPALYELLAERLGSIKSRELGFQIARLLGPRVRSDPNIRRSLLHTIRDPHATGRSSALYAVNGIDDDPELARAISATFQEPGAETQSATAAAFVLGGMMPALSEPSRKQLRSHARRLLNDPATPTALRVETVDLLDPKSPSDQARLRRLSARTSQEEPTLVLAAARRLLTTGAPSGPVLANLRRLAARPGLDPVLAKTLQGILDSSRR